MTKVLGSDACIRSRPVAEAKSRTNPKQQPMARSTRAAAVLILCKNMETMTPRASRAAALPATKPSAMRMVD